MSHFVSLAVAARAYLTSEAAVGIRDTESQISHSLDKLDASHRI